MVERFGGEIGFYTKMYKLGLWMTLVGIIIIVSAIFFNNFIISTISIVLIFLGIMLAFAGYTGYKDEKKKFGMVKHYTHWGSFGTGFGIASVFTMGHMIFISIILGVIGIIFGIIAKKKGDNVNAEGGTYIGTMGIVGNLIIIILLYFFPTT